MWNHNKTQSWRSNTTWAWLVMAALLVLMANVWPRFSIATLFCAIFGFMWHQVRLSHRESGANVLPGGDWAVFGRQDMADSANADKITTLRLEVEPKKSYKAEIPGAEQPCITKDCPSKMYAMKLAGGIWWRCDTCKTSIKSAEGGAVVTAPDLLEMYIGGEE